MNKNNKEKNKNNKTMLLYGIAILALIISITSLLINIPFKKADFDWRCNVANCTEYVEIGGEEWARENCVITSQGTICLATFDDGRQFEIPLEELNLSAIVATKCINFVCTEETPYKIVNYPLKIN